MVAQQAAALAWERQGREEQRRERRRRAADPASWLERATAQLFDRLDGRRAKPGPDAEAAFVVALRELVAESEGARFVAQCLELDPVEVRRLVRPIDVS